ncbi:MAG: ATP-binding cassette domain-containing protein [Microthrixaceae bacterium]|nr:ATP-binding cassette domain-containing protein [Microthrixaceae bacterium]
MRLADEVAAMPDGLQTAVGWNGSSLSGGQVQRVCLARALLMDPKVLVLDEFTANLNTGLEDEIRVALAEWGREPTVIEVTHRPDAVPNAVVVAVLDDGLLFVE